MSLITPLGLGWHSFSWTTVPKLLLSFHDLVDLHLWDISSPVYLTPEEIATCLSNETPQATENQI